MLTRFTPVGATAPFAAEQLEQRLALAADFVAQITSPPSGAVLARGAQHTVLVVVSNIGDTRARNFGLSLFASENETLNLNTATLLETRNVSSLNAGEQELKDIDFYLPGSLPNGEYYLFALIDPANVIAENNENNNQSSAQAVTFAAHSGGGGGGGGTTLPDVTVSLLTPAQGTSLVRGTEQKLFVSLHNAGGTSTGRAFRVAIYASTDDHLDPAGDLLLGSRLISSLSAGERETEDVEFVVPPSLPAGNITLYALADTENTVTESDESNNRSEPVVLVSRAPTLAITGVLNRITLEDSVVEGRKERGGVRVRLESSSDDALTSSASLTLRTVLRPVQAEDDSGDVPVSASRTARIASLSRGRNLTLSITIPAGINPGEYHVVTIVENALSDDRITIVADSSFAVVPAFIDLAATTVKSSIRGPIFSGQRASIHTKVTNLGNIRARGDVTVQYFLRDTLGIETAISLPITKRVNVNPARQSGAIPGRITIPSQGLVAGSTYTLFARITPHQDLTDSAPDNHERVLRDFVFAG